MAKQSTAEHYAMNAQHDIKTGEGTKADIMYDVKKLQNTDTIVQLKSTTSQTLIV